MLVGTMATRIGVGVGMSIILSDDESVSYRGGGRDEVLAQAVARVRSGTLPDEKSAFVRRWLALMLEVIEKEELEQKVEAEFSKRMKAGAREFKQLPGGLRAAVESVTREFAKKAVIERSGKKLG